MILLNLHPLDQPSSVCLISRGFSGRLSRMAPLPKQLGFREFITEERRWRTEAKRRWAGRPGPAGLAHFRPGSSPSFATCCFLHFGVFPPSDMGFGRHYLRDQVKGCLCMIFRSFHLGPRRFFFKAHWSLPPLESSSHMVGAS